MNREFIPVCFFSPGRGEGLPELLSYERDCVHNTNPLLHPLCMDYMGQNKGKGAI